MTVTNTTTTTLATTIKDVVEEEVLIAAFQNTEFTKQLTNPYPLGTSVSDHTYKINAIVTSNAEVAAKTEANDAYPDESASVYQQAAFDFVTIYGAVAITDDVKRAMPHGDRDAVTPGMLGDITDTINQVRDLFETTMMADAATGLQGQVDDDSTAWGGVNRGTYTNLKSHVEAGGSANLTAAMLHAALRTLRAPNFGAKPEVIWSNAFQQSYYLERLVADPQGAPGGNADITYSGDKVYFAQIPWIAIPDFVASEVTFASGVRDGSGIILVDHNYWDVAVWPEADPPQFAQVQCGPESWLNLSHVMLGRTKPHTSHVFGLCGAVIVRKPNKQGKIEALATS